MKTKLIILSFLVTFQMTHLLSQSNASSSGSGMIWTIQSGNYYSTPSKIVLTGNSSIGGSVLIQSDNGMNGYGNITLNANSGPIYFNTNGATKMALLNNGWLGIGISSGLLAQLHVQAVNTTGIYLKHQVTSNYAYAMAINVNNLTTKAFSLSNTINNVTNQDVFYINGDGQVYAPGVTASGFLASNIGAWGYGFKVTAGDDNAKAFSVTNKSNNEIFYVMGNGVVNATNIYAQGFQVRPDAIGQWYDYVFSSNYKLKPLHDVEKFVNENNHLPEIPSEKEVKEKGLNMADMDGLLLKKIEELTLYVIQQQKEIEQLKQKVNNNN